jgi:ribosomal protein L12E/L44/L45/RPP1/RPP2
VTRIDIEAAGRIADMDIFKGMGLSILPVQENALVGQNTAMQQVPTLDLGRETYLGLQIFESKRDQVLGISAPQGGVQNDTSRTATEIATVQRNADARFEQERQRALAWWIRGVQKLSAFVVRYGDRCAQDILGQQRAQQWMQFRQQGFLGQFTFEVMIDSGKYLDVEQDRRQFLQILNYSAKSPFINQQKMWETFCVKFGFDPQQWLAQPQPPKPEPPKIALALSGDDLAEPQSSMVVEILAAQGVQISPAAIQNMVLALKAKQQAEQQVALTKANPVLGLMAEPPAPEPAPPQPGQPGMPPGNPATPGTADQAERLDKHGLQESGSLPGAGAAPGPGAGPVLA